MLKKTPLVNPTFEDSYGSYVVMSLQIGVEVVEDVQILKVGSQENEIHLHKHQSQKGNFPSPTVDAISALTQPQPHPIMLGSRYR